MELNIEEISRSEELAENAQSRSLFYSFITIPFSAIPNLKFIEKVRCEEFIITLENLIKEQLQTNDIAVGATLMLNYLNSFSKLAEDELLKKLGIDRTRLYGGITPNYGPPPPYEAVWSALDNDAATILEILTVIYRQSGLALSDETAERPDSIKVELEYLRQLTLMEEKAWRNRDLIKAKEHLEQQYSFISGHLEHWVPLFVEQASSKAETDFYKGHLVMLRGFLIAEKEYLQSLLEECRK